MQSCKPNDWAINGSVNLTFYNGSHSKRLKQRALHVVKEKQNISSRSFLHKGAYFKDDRYFFGLFLSPSPSECKMMSLLLNSLDVTFTNTDRIW